MPLASPLYIPNFNEELERGLYNERLFHAIDRELECETQRQIQWQANRRPRYMVYNNSDDDWDEDDSDVDDDLPRPTPFTENSYADICSENFEQTDQLLIELDYSTEHCHSNLCSDEECEATTESTNYVHIDLDENEIYSEIQEVLPEAVVPTEEYSSDFWIENDTDVEDYFSTLNSHGENNSFQFLPENEADLQEALAMLTISDEEDLVELATSADL